MKLKSIVVLIIALNLQCISQKKIYLEKDLLFPPPATQSASFKNCSAMHAGASTWGQISPGFTVMHEHLKIQNCAAVPWHGICHNFHVLIWTQRMISLTFKAEMLTFSSTLLFLYIYIYMCVCVYTWFALCKTGNEYSTMHKGERGLSTGQRSIFPQLFQLDLQKHNLILGDPYATVSLYWKFCTS